MGAAKGGSTRRDSGDEVMRFTPWWMFWATAGSGLAILLTIGGSMLATHSHNKHVSRETALSERRSAVVRFVASLRQVANATKELLELNKAPISPLSNTLAPRLEAWKLRLFTTLSELGLAYSSMHAAWHRCAAMELRISESRAKALSAADLVAQSGAANQGLDNRLNRLLNSVVGSAAATAERPVEQLSASVSALAQSAPAKIYSDEENNALDGAICALQDAAQSITDMLQDEHKMACGIGRRRCPHPSITQQTGKA